MTDRRHIDWLRVDVSKLQAAVDWDAIISRLSQDHAANLNRLRQAKDGNLLAVHDSLQLVMDRPELSWGPAPERAEPPTVRAAVPQPDSPEEEK